MPYRHNDCDTKLGTDGSGNTARSSTLNPAPTLSFHGRHFSDRFGSVIDSEDRDGGGNKAAEPEHILKMQKWQTV